MALDRPLAYLHPGSGEFRCEVANLTRNVVIESADLKARGHTVYHKYSAGSLAYAEFRHPGKEGVLGKYPIHYDPPPPARGGPSRTQPGLDGFPVRPVGAA